MNVMRVLNTVRHLRGRQVAAQITHRLRPLLEDPSKLRAMETPPYPDCVWSPLRPWPVPGPPTANRPEEITAGRLEFLRQPAQIGWPPRWEGGDFPMLWRYNLHYFDYLHRLGGEAAKVVVADWIDRHPPARGQIGWDPYPTSLRLVNWCGVFFGDRRHRDALDPPFRQKLWESIHRQACWLERHLETHLLGNHLLENAAALATVGSCFGGAAAGRWLRTGRKLLGEQLAEQILADGGHCERSPMYQARVVYVLAMLRNIDGSATIEIEDHLARAMVALKHMTHPDARIALLNDSAMGIGNEPPELAAFAGQRWSTDVGNFALPETGYYGARTSDGSYVICDAGPIGPDYQPGHGHGDTLSFELSRRGRRVVVDGGVYDYEPSDMRAYCRSTRAHNTVEIDDQDQCEFWGTFRVARRAHVHDVRWVPFDDGFRLEASHDGYERLPGRPRHRRSVRWHDRGGLVIRDRVVSGSPHQIVSRLRLHPDCRVLELSRNEARIDDGTGLPLRIVARGEGAMALEPGWYCPEFGLKLPSQAIAWRAAPVIGNTAEMAFGIGDETVGQLVEAEDSSAERERR